MTGSYWDVFWPVLGLAVTAFTVLVIAGWFLAAVFKILDDGRGPDLFNLLLALGGVVVAAGAGTGFYVILQATGWTW